MFQRTTSILLIHQTAILYDFSIFGIWKNLMNSPKPAKKIGNNLKEFLDYWKNVLRWDIVTLVKVENAHLSSKIWNIWIRRWKKIDFLRIFKPFRKNTIDKTNVNTVDQNNSLQIPRPLEHFGHFQGGGSVQNPEPSGACGGLLFGRVNVSKLYEISINIQFIINNSFL